MTVLKHRPTFARISGKAFVDGTLVAEAVLSCAVADRPKDETHRKCRRFIGRKCLH